MNVSIFCYQGKNIEFFIFISYKGMMVKRTTILESNHLLKCPLVIKMPIKNMIKASIINYFESIFLQN